MSRKTSSSRQQLRAFQRERVKKSENQIAKALNIPKGLRQYCARLGSQPSDILSAYLKNKTAGALS
jgi:hypothetical protein